MNWVGRWMIFFSSRRRHTRWNCDWSSDVCSSDLPCLVRGLDYYTRTTFEIVLNSASTPDLEGLALGGGGRYDGLIPMLGGRENTSAMGAAMGVERIVLAMKAANVMPP